jgi:hypothetical protein
MDVTRIIRFRGSAREALVFERMLEEEGIHVELRASLSARKSLVRARRRALQEGQAQAQGELMARHDRERETLGARQPPQDQDQERWRLEWQEMQQRHGRELQQLDQRYAQERLKLAELKTEVASFDPGTFYLADLNQVAISLLTTGLAAAIAKAVRRYRDRAPDSNVEVEEHEPGSAPNSRLQVGSDTEDVRDADC